MTSNPEFGKFTNAYSVTATFRNAIKGKVVLITGVNDGGIGGATARALASESPKMLIMTGRTTAKVQVVIDSLSRQFPQVEYKAVACDLSSQTKVRKASEEINSLTARIDIVINNAGIMMVPTLQHSEDGIELQFATNHIGHFLLINLLMPRLIAAAKMSPAETVRIINVSSFGHNFSAFRSSDLGWEKPSSSIPESERDNLTYAEQIGLPINKSGPYSPVGSYGNSKTANILFSLALNKRLLQKHGISSFALHPGSIMTELGRHVDPDTLNEARTKAGNMFLSKNLDQGASTQLVAALDPMLRVEGTNIYLDDCQLKEANEWARDESAAEKLWSTSEELVKEIFVF